MDHPDPASELERILRAENAALERHDGGAAAALLDAKLAAAHALSLAPLTLETVGRLQALALENRRLLERAIDVQTRILAMVARAAQEAPPAARYGARGRAVQPGGAIALVRQA